MAYSGVLIAILALALAFCTAGAQSVSITPVNTVLDVGQYVVYGVTVNGGTGPFTVQLMGSGTVLATATISSPGGSTTLSYLTTGTSPNTFNVVATDNGNSTSTPFSSASSTLTINPALGTPDVPAMTSVADAGQSVTVSSGISNVNGTGSGTIAYGLLYSTSESGPFTGIAGASCSPSGGNVFCSFTANAAGNFYYEINATDQATVPETTTSQPTTGYLMINPELFMSIPLPSATGGTYGNPETLSAVITGGTAPYTVNGIKGAVEGQMPASDCSISGASLSCSFLLPAVEATIGDMYTITIQDAKGEQYANNTNVTVSPMGGSSGTGVSSTTPTSTTTIAPTNLTNSTNSTSTNLNATTTIAAPGFKLAIPQNTTVVVENLTNSTNSTNSTSGLQPSSALSGTSPAVVIPVSIGAIIAIVAGYMLTRNSGRPRRRHR